MIKSLLEEEDEAQPQAGNQLGIKLNPRRCRRAAVSDPLIAPTTLPPRRRRMGFTMLERLQVNWERSMSRLPVLHVSSIFYQKFSLLCFFYTVSYVY